MEKNMTKILFTLLLIFSVTLASAQTGGGTDTSSSSSSNSSSSSSGSSSNDQVVEEITCVAEDLKRMLVIRLHELFSKSTIDVEEI